MKIKYKNLIKEDEYVLFGLEYNAETNQIFIVLFSQAIIIDL